MSRLDTRLTRELGEIADRATMSPEAAIESIRARAAETDLIEEEEVVVMLAPADTRGRWKARSAYPALAVAAAVVLVLVGVFVLRDGEPDEQLSADIPPPADTIAPVADATAFDPDRDDLCEWLTDEDVASFVSAELDGIGEVEAQLESTDRLDDRYADCEWQLLADGRAVGELGVSDARAWTNFNEKPYVFPYDHQIVGYDTVADSERYPDDPGWIPPSSAVSGHFAVTDGVVVHNGGFGMFAFWVRGSEDYVQVSLLAPDPVPSHELFGVADRVLQALGWVE